MIALNGDCRECKHYGADWACCTDYCKADHDEEMFADKDKCEYSEKKHDSGARMKGGE